MGGFREYYGESERTDVIESLIEEYWHEEASEIVKVAKSNNIEDLIEYRNEHNISGNGLEWVACLFSSTKTIIEMRDNYDSNFSFDCIDAYHSTNTDSLSEFNC